VEEEPVQPEPASTVAPTSPVDRAAPEQAAADRAFDELFGPDAATASTTTVLATRRDVATASDRAPKRTAKPARRRPNPYAAIPYCIGIAVLALEAFLIV
jgi:hypothetical protein